MPLLVVDGILGPKTLARVKTFQAENGLVVDGLVVDGLVGPKTWAALAASNSPVVPHRTGCDCGQHDPANQSIGQRVKSLYFQLVNLGAAVGLGAFGAEQAANAVEHGNSTVCITVKAAARNTVVAKNVTSLTLTQFGDRRTPKIVY